MWVIHKFILWFKEFLISFFEKNFLFLGLVGISMCYDSYINTMECEQNFIEGIHSHYKNTTFGGESQPDYPF